MRAVRVLLPCNVYKELRQVSAAINEKGYGPAAYIADVVAADVATRRLPVVAPGSHGPRMNSKTKPEQQTYRVTLPSNGEL